MLARPPSPRQRRALWATLAVLCSFWIGLVAGTLAGALFFVPADSGLAGPAIALGYGIGGALAGAVLGGIVARRLPPRRLRRAAVAIIVVAALAALVVGYLFVRQQAERRGLARVEPAGARSALGRERDDQREVGLANALHVEATRGAGHAREGAPSGIGGLRSPGLARWKRTGLMRATTNARR